MSKKIIFRKIKLKNYKCHSELYIDFYPNRFILFVGNNGSGKSSVLSALCWALYDDTPEGVSGDSIVKKNSNGTCVEVEFSIGDDIYTVIAYRKDKVHKNNRYVYCNNQNISGPTNSDTLNIISKILVPKDIFFNCILFSNSMDRFINRRPSEQMDLIDLILNFNDYDIFKNKFKEKISIVENDITKLNKEKELYLSLENDFINNLSIEEKNIENYRKSLEEEKLDISNKISGLKSSIDTYKSELNKYSNIQEKYNDYKIKLQNVLEKLNMIEESKRKDIENLKNKYINEFNSLKSTILSERTIEINNLENKIKNIIDNIEQIEKEYNSNVQLIDKNIRYDVSNIELKYKDSLNSLNTEYKELTNNLKNVLDNITKIKSEIENLSYELENLDNNINSEVPTCYVCKQPVKNESLSNVKMHRSNIESKVNSLNKDLNKFIEQKHLYESKLDYIKKELNNLTKNLEREKQDIYRKYEKEKVELARIYKTNREKIIKDKETLEREKDKIELIYKNKILEEQNKYKQKYIEEEKNIINTYKNEIEALNYCINEYKNKINEIESNINKYKELENIITTSLEELYRLEEKYNNIENTYNALIEKSETNIQTIKNKMEECKEKIKNIEINIERNEQLKEIYEFWYNAFSDKGIKGIILDEIIPVLNRICKEFLRDTPLSISFNSTVTTKKGDIKNLFNVEVLHTKNLSSSIQELSSGEKKLVDIVTTLSIKKLYEIRHDVDINLVLLDEILDSLDEYNCMYVIENLKKLFRDKTIILITHTLRSNIKNIGEMEVYNF